MKHRDLRERVCEANREIGRSGLAMLTWGNASGADRTEGVVAIKPSGVAYETLCPEDIVVLDLASGAVVDGVGRPSSDTPTHLVLYRRFPAVAGVVHTHSRHATAWAQACRELPCYGTTHADTFHGPVPVTRLLTAAEVERDYEMNTGLVIVERFEQGRIDPVAVPGVLAAGHAPFAWGGSPAQALEHARVLEETARMAFESLALNPGLQPLPAYLMDKHYLRKHGAQAYDGQPPTG
jgi:L-ribulose-5-phosphate 4-epimerase